MKTILIFLIFAVINQTAISQSATEKKNIIKGNLQFPLQWWSTYTEDGKPSTFFIPFRASYVALGVSIERKLSKNLSGEAIVSYYAGGGGYYSIPGMPVFGGELKYYLMEVLNGFYLGGNLNLGLPTKGMYVNFNGLAGYQVKLSMGLALGGHLGLGFGSWSWANVYNNNKRVSYTENGMFFNPGILIGYEF